MNRIEEAWQRGIWMLRLPLRVGSEAILQLPRNLAPEEWDQLMRLLDVMKPGLVREPEVDGGETP